MSDRVTSEGAPTAGDARKRRCYWARVGASDFPRPNVGVAARLGGVVLVLAGAVLAACGGSSSASSAPSAGAAATPAGSGGTPPSAGGGNGKGGTGAGSGSVGDGGEPIGATPGRGGDGGAPMSLPDEAQLGGACESAGALACAGAHQKLTLVCSASGKWEANQTCPSGQFCSSTPGPDLGICRAPEADCAERQPGDFVCASDGITLLQCDEDGIAAAEIEQCQLACVDGTCGQSPPCPENIVYSCDSRCPGPPNTNPSCFDLCPTPARSGASPILGVSNIVPRVKWAIVLPVVAPNSQPCTCVEANGALQGVAFRVPSPLEGRGHRWRFTYPKAWEFRSSQDAATAALNDYYQACKLAWPGRLSATPGCATIGPGSADALVWLAANSPVTEPGTVVVELLPDAEATCEP